METKFNNISFSDNDIVNLNDWIPNGEYNPHKVRPFLLHDFGMAIAVVFADCLQDAIDEAVDDDRLDRYLLTREEEKEYIEDKNEESISYLGNAGQPFDISTLQYIDELDPNWNQYYDNWLKGKNPTDSPEWKKGIFALTKELPCDLNHLENN